MSVNASSHFGQSRSKGFCKLENSRHVFSPLYVHRKIPTTSVGIFHQILSRNLSQGKESSNLAKLILIKVYSGGSSAQIQLETSDFICDPQLKLLAKRYLHGLKSVHNFGILAFFALKTRKETRCWIKIFGKKCNETKLYKVNKFYSKLKNGEYLMISNIFAATPFRMRGLYNLSSCPLVGWFGTFSHSQMSTRGKIFGCEKLDNKICVREVEKKVSMSKIQEFCVTVFSFNSIFF